MVRESLSALLLGVLVAGTAVGQTPRPFPGAATPPPQAPRTTPAPEPPRGAPPTQAPVAPPSAPSPASQRPATAPPAPTAATLGVAIYPAAQFLASYDAGRGQRFFLFGTTATYNDIVAYYRTQLMDGGDVVFKEPPTHMFDVGRFREEAMAFPPGVTIKEFQSQMSQGYPNPRLGAQPTHFPTVIQIVPVTPEAR